MHKADDAGWKWNHYELDNLDVAFGWLWGVVLRGWMLIGLVIKPNYPPDDPVWPGRSGEIGIVLCNHVWGWWNDPGV